MVSLKLLTSTTSSLPPDIIQRHHIQLIPFTVQFLDGNYKESEDLDLNQFYQRLSSAEAIPSTMPTSIAQWAQVFQQLGDSTEVALVFHVASHLSKSYENAVQAATRISQPRVINVDTQAFSMGSGLQVIEVAQAVEAGQSIDQLLALIEQLKSNTFMVFAPASVRYLRMSGRVGRLPAMAASLLGIQPVIALGPSGLDVVERPRSPEAARIALLEQVSTFIGAGRPRCLAVVHTNALEGAQHLYQQVTSQYPGVPVYLSDAGPILAVHGGPGILGLAVIREL